MPELTQEQLNQLESENKQILATPIPQRRYGAGYDVRKYQQQLQEAKTQAAQNVQAIQQERERQEKVKQYNQQIAQQQAAVNAAKQAEVDWMLAERFYEQKVDPNSVGGQAGVYLREIYRGINKRRDVYRDKQAAEAALAEAQSNQAAEQGKSGNIPYSQYKTEEFKRKLGIGEPIPTKSGDYPYNQYAPKPTYEEFYKPYSSAQKDKLLADTGVAQSRASAVPIQGPQDINIPKPVKNQPVDNDIRRDFRREVGIYNGTNKYSYITDSKPDTVNLPDYLVEKTKQGIKNAEYNLYGEKGLKGGVVYRAGSRALSTVYETGKSVGKGGLRVLETTATSSGSIAIISARNPDISEEISKRNERIASDEDVKTFATTSAFLAAQLNPFTAFAADIPIAYSAGKSLGAFIKEPNPEGFTDVALLAAPLAFSKTLEYSAYKGDIVFKTVDVPLEVGEIGLMKRGKFGRQRASVIVEDAEGKVMLAVDKNSGSRILPGGSLDAGETAVEAAARELMEETGIRARPKDLEYMGTIAATTEETSAVFRYRLPEGTKIQPKSDVTKIEFVNPKSIKYQKPTEFNPFGQRTKVSDIVTGRYTRSDTALIIDKYINKAAIDTVALPALVPRSVKGDVTYFEREGKTYFIERVSKPKLTQPSSLLDYAKGRQPGEFKQFITKQVEFGEGMLSDIGKQDVIFLARTSRYNVNPESMAKYVKESDLLIASGSPNPPKTKGIFNREFDIISGNPRGEQGMFFQPPLYPGGPRYLGVSYLQLGKSDFEGFSVTFKFPKRTILMGAEKGPKEFARTTEPGALTFTKKAIYGSESEFILRPGTTVEYLSSKAFPTGIGPFGGGDSVTRLYGKKVRLNYVQLVESTDSSLKKAAAQNTFDMPSKNVKEIYINPYTPLGASKRRESEEGFTKKELNTSTLPMKESKMIVPKYIETEMYKPRYSEKGFDKGKSYMDFEIPKPEPRRPIKEIPRGFTDTEIDIPDTPRTPPPRPRPITPKEPGLPRLDRAMPPPRRTSRSGGSRMKLPEPSTKGFDVFVRKSGKFKTVGTNLPIGKANLLGAKEVTSTLAATYRVRASGRTTTLPDVGFKPSSKIFRAPFKKSKLNDSMTYIQKAGTRREGPTIKGARLASIGERQALSAARRGMLK